MLPANAALAPKAKDADLAVPEAPEAPEVAAAIVVMKPKKARKISDVVASVETKRHRNRSKALSPCSKELDYPKTACAE